jgi:co-chaperonin GroES (HSP10)
MKINYKPTFNNVVLVEPIIKETTKSGIIKPESLTAEERQNLNKLEVAAVGPDVKSCKAGDLISLNRFAPGTVTPIEVDNVRYLVIPENGIIGVYVPVLKPIFDTTTVVN